MNRTILIAGHGPGISNAVARRFGSEGLSVALVARNAERIEAAAGELKEAGIAAQAFACDLGNPDAVRALVQEVRSTLGPLQVVHWNAYATGASDLTTAPLTELQNILDTGLFGLLAAVQESLPDLESGKGAFLVTGGGFALYSPEVDGYAVAGGAMGLAVAKAAQHKVVGLLHNKLAPRGVYVGEVVVLGMVKGTKWDSGSATLEPAEIAEAFWGLYTERAASSVTFG